MKQLCYLFLGVILVVGLGNCGTERPVYNLELLQGTWRRISGNNPDADSMLLKVQGTSAVILYAPPYSNFSRGEQKWTRITPVVAPNNFTLLDKSTDDNQWGATILVEIFERDTIVQFSLKSDKYLAAPGGIQVWVRE